MSTSILSNAGRWMLNRRDFLRFGGTGLSGIALLSLLADQSRQRHFVPKAKNVPRLCNCWRSYSMPVRVLKKVVLG